MINLGSSVSFGDSLIITVFSMVTVFVALYVISLLIDLLRVAVDKGENNKEKNNTNTHEPKKVEKEHQPTVEENVDDEELIAVISAAIAASLGVAVPEVNIKSIKRVPQTAPLWAEMGRREQILSKTNR